MVFVSNMIHFRPLFAIALLRSPLNGRSWLSYISERCGSKKRSKDDSTFRVIFYFSVTRGGNSCNRHGAERARKAPKRRLWRMKRGGFEEVSHRAGMKCPGGG